MLAIRNKKRRGFTFLELLIALTIFVVGVTSVLQIFPINRRFLMQSSYQTQAAFLAQEEIERTRSVPYSSLTPGTYVPRAKVEATGVFSQFERQVDIIFVNANYTTEMADKGMKKITVTVFWYERSIQRQFSLTTFQYDH